MRTFHLPDLGEGLQDAEIVSWHVVAGERVVTDQPLLSVETDKAVVEVPAPWSGKVTKLYANAGDVINIGAPLADFDNRELDEDAGAVVGELPQPAIDQGVSIATATPTATGQQKIKAIPAARKMARELGFALENVIGTGPDGVITRADVAAAVNTAQDHAGDWEPLRGVRRAMARNMTQAHAEIATTNVVDEAKISHWASTEDITMRLVRSIVAGCTAEPALNAWYNANREARLLHEHIDLGIAMNTTDGLFVPVLRDVGHRMEIDLRNGFDTMKRDVAARSVPPSDLHGQTITLSNFGMIGGQYATLVVMPPQVAIIGAGRISDKPRIVKGEIVVSKVLPLSLTFDHRAVTGAEAARFLMAAINDLEK